MYFIIEVANTHGGRFDYLISLMKEFAPFKKNFGIKFQPFKFDEIAIESYNYYSVYQELFFSKSQWKEIIYEASKTKDVWLDIFDSYGLEILRDNFDFVFGIKFQTSVLENQKLLSKLEQFDLCEKKIIINIAGRPIEDINLQIEKFEKQFKVKNVLVEVGFQAYPTKLDDSGISKIKSLKKTFKNEIVFADHVDGSSKDAITLPLMGMLSGASIIEKHVMHSTFETKYDHYSAVKLEKFTELVKEVRKYENLLLQPFISKAETNYLDSTIQIPVLSMNKEKGSTLQMEDFDFKRSSMKGLNIKEIKAFIDKGFKLAINKSKNQTIVKEDLIL